MRKTLGVILILAVTMGALVASPAEAAKKKKKKKAKPVPVTLFMHGQAPFGEVDGAAWLADGGAPQSPMTIDAVEPEGGNAKSMAIGSPIWNDQCTGLPLGFPTFTGELSGTIVGDAKLKLTFQGAGTPAVARLWVDVGAFQACNDDYIPPHAEVEFDAASGEVEVVFPDLNLPAQSSIMVEILSPDTPTPTTRLQYDASSARSTFSFDCVPASGTSCTPPAG